MRSWITAVTVALLTVIVVCAGPPATAAEPPAPATGDTLAFPDTQEPVRAGGKKRRNKGKRNKRKRHKKDKPQKAKKNKTNKKHRNTEAVDRPADKPKKDKPAHNKPNRDKPAYDPKRPNTHRKRQRLVCIGGRVRAGRCLCRRTHSRRDVRTSVVSCRTSAAVAALPQLVPDQPPALPDPGTPPPSAPRRDLPDSVRDEVLATLTAASTNGDDDAIARDQGLVAVEQVQVSLLDLRVVRFRIPDGRSVIDVVAALAADARVISAQPNYYYRRDDGDAETPTDALQYALAKVDLDTAHVKARGRVCSSP